MKGYFNI